MKVINYGQADQRPSKNQHSSHLSGVLCQWFLIDIKVAFVFFLTDLKSEEVLNSSEYLLLLFYFLSYFCIVSKHKKHICDCFEETILSNINIK